MEKNSENKKKESLFAYMVVLVVFIVFVISIFAGKKFNLGNNIPITGNAVLNTGQLNSSYVFAILILISVYAIITCSYLSYRSRKLENKG